jgi:uncharacterized protein YgiM (DUF1202 family)
MRNIKHLPAIFTLLVVLSLLLPSLALAAPVMAAEWTYVVDAPLGLRMHAEAGLLSPVVIVLYNGEDVRVEGDAVYAQGLWWSPVRVERRAGDSTGWVASAYLANYKPDDSAEGPESGVVYTVTARLGLNLRAAPGMAAKVVCTVPTGTRLVATVGAVTKRDGLTWREFTLGDQTVWATESFLEASEAE